MISRNAGPSGSGTSMRWSRRPGAMSSESTPSGRLVDASTSRVGNAFKPSSSSQNPLMSGPAASRARSGGSRCSSDRASASSKKMTPFPSEPASWKTSLITSAAFGPTFEVSVVSRTW